MIDRGFSIVALHSPKTAVNVGSVIRAGGIFGVKSVIYTGKRFKKGFVTDPVKHHKQMPVINVPNLEDYIPMGCVPVAVDLVDGARSILTYKHPRNAFYIFGPEDGTLGSKHLSICKDVIYIPTDGCLNLACSVNVVLYDRMAKQENDRD